MYAYFFPSNSNWALYDDIRNTWGTPQFYLIPHVLESVKIVFEKHFGYDSVNSYNVAVFRTTAGYPSTFRKHSIIFLDVDGLYICQSVYQFSHELCHILFR